MVEKNLKKLKAKKRRVVNGFNTGTRDMKLKTAYRRNKRWSADESTDHHPSVISLMRMIGRNYSRLQGEILSQRQEI